MPSPKTKKPTNPYILMVHQPHWKMTSTSVHPFTSRGAKLSHEVWSHCPTWLRRLEPRRWKPVEVGWLVIYPHCLLRLFCWNPMVDFTRFLNHLLYIPWNFQCLENESLPFEMVPFLGRLCLLVSGKVSLFGYFAGPKMKLHGDFQGFSLPFPPMQHTFAGKW